MIIVNWPFFVSMIVLVFLVPLHLFEGDWGFMKRIAEKRSIRKIKKVNSEKRGGAPNRLILLLKKGFTVSEEEKKLKRPFYTMIPFVLVFLGYNLLPMWLNWPRWEWPDAMRIASIVLLVTLLLFSQVLTILFANREHFRDKMRRRAYIKDQGMAYLVALLFLIVLLGLLDGIFGVHLVEKDPKWLKNSVEWVLEPEYEAVWPAFSEGMVEVSRRGKYGYMDKEGNMVIEPGYTAAGEFHEGLAAVEYKRKWGYIDKNGRAVIPFVYEIATPFNEGIASVEKDGAWMVIDKWGQVVFETDFHWMSAYSEGVAVVEVSDETYPKLIRQNLVDKEGHLLFRKEYASLSHGNFSEGCIPAKEKGSRLYYFIDKNEERVIERGFVEAQSFSGGVAAVVMEDGGKTVYINRRGVVLLEVEEEFPNSMSEGLIRYKEGDRYGFKDIHGVERISIRFRMATDSSEGLIGLSFNGKWGFIKNPLPEIIQEQGSEFWMGEGLIGSIEGIPLYASQVEDQVRKVQHEQWTMPLKDAYLIAFEALKKEKALEKYGKEVPPEQIQFQLAKGYYKKMLLGLPD